MKRLAQLWGGEVRFAVLKWICTFGTKLCLNIELFSDDKVIVMEVDELWHYLKKRSKNFGFLKAYDHYGKRHIDWECGDRSHAPFKNL